MRWTRIPVPSRPMAVALLALFLNLTGLAYATTGGNFILGHSNSANLTTALTGTPATGAALSVTNATAGQPAAGFHVASTATPFTVSSSTKVAKLNADLLDGVDSTGFQQSRDLVRVDAVINFGGTQSWAIGPNITIYATCTKDASGNRIFTQRLLNNSPSSGQWITGEIANVSPTNPATAETHGGSAGSGGDTQVSVQQNPETSALVGTSDVENLIWRDDSHEVVTGTYTATAFTNYCEIVGTLTHTT